MVTAVLKKVGPHGTVLLEKSKSSETAFDYVEGYVSENGFLSGSFVTDNLKGRAVLNDPFVLVSLNNIQKMEDVLPHLEFAMGKKRPLAILCQ